MMNAKLTIPILVLAFLLAMGVMAFGDTVVYDETAYLSSDYSLFDDDTIVRSDSASSSGVVVIDTDDFVLIDENGDVNQVEETTWYDPESKTLTTVQTPKAKETKVIYAKYLVDEPDVIIPRPYTRVYYDPYYFTPWRPYRSYTRIYEPLTWRFAFGGWWVDRDFAIGVGFGRTYSPWYYSNSWLVYDPYLYSPYYYDPYYYAPTPVSVYNPYWDYPYYGSTFSISFNYYSGHRRHWSPWYWSGGGYYDYYYPYRHYRSHRYDRVRHTDDHGGRYDYVDGNRPRIDEPYTRIAAGRRAGEVGLRDPLPGGHGLENRSIALNNRNWIDRSAPATRLDSAGATGRTASTGRIDRSGSVTRDTGSDRTGLRDVPAGRGSALQTSRDAATQSTRGTVVPNDRSNDSRAMSREVMPSDRSRIETPASRGTNPLGRSAGTSRLDDSSAVRRGIPSRTDSGEAVDAPSRNLRSTENRVSRSGISTDESQTELAGVRRRNVPGLNDLQPRTSGSRSIKSYPTTRDRDALIDASRGRTPRNYDRSGSSDVRRPESVNRDLIEDVQNQGLRGPQDQGQRSERSTRNSQQNSRQSFGRNRYQQSNMTPQNDSSSINVPSRASNNRDDSLRSQSTTERGKPVYLRPSFSSSTRQSREFARVPEQQREPEATLNESQNRTSSRNSSSSSTLNRSRSNQRNMSTNESLNTNSRSSSRYSSPSSTLNRSRSNQSNMSTNESYNTRSRSSSRYSSPSSTLNRSRSNQSNMSTNESYNTRSRSSSRYSAPTSGLSAPRTYSAPSSSGRSLGSNRMPSSSSRLSSPSGGRNAMPVAPASRGSSSSGSRVRSNGR